MRSILNWFRALGSAAKQSIKEFMAGDAFSSAAALSFYMLLSIAPLLLVLVAAGGLIFGQEAMRGQIIAQIQGLVGLRTAKTIQYILSQAGQLSGGITLATGIVIALIGTTTVFIQLQKSLNQIWQVKVTPARTIISLWIMVRDRGLSLAVVLIIWALLLASIIANMAIAAAKQWIVAKGPWFASSWWLWSGVNEGVSLLMITILVAIIFKILPDVIIGWGKVWVGAIITAGLFWIGKYAIGFYLGYVSTGSAYGTAGSLVVLLMWVYYSSLIFFFGAHITRVYTLRTGEKIKPSRHATLGHHY